MNTTHSSDRGQALVLIILTFVGVLGLSALAIDGGMVYAERRRAQNAADAAVYAGALVRARGGTVTDAMLAALNQASANGFVSSGSITVDFHNNPLEEPAPAAYINDPAYYQVVIHAQVAPIFAQFVFSGQLNYTVSAIARAAPTSPLANGAAMFSTSSDPNRCDPLNFSGGGVTTIEGGNIMSNNPNDPADPNIGRNNCHAGRVSGNGTVNVMAPYNIQTVGSWGGCGNSCTINAGGPGAGDDVVAHVQPLALPTLPDPDCSEASMGPMKTIPNNHARPFVMTPGRWSGVAWSGGDGELRMEPGMYCIYNGFSVNGGTLKSIAANGQPEGVFFVVLSGDFSTNGNANVVLNRPNNLVSNGFQWGGYLLYMPENNHGLVSFGGGGTSTYSGTIYAPGPTAQNSQDKCDVDGSAGSVGLNSQIVCDTVNVTGNGNVFIHYNPDENGQVPPVIELMN